MTVTFLGVDFSSAPSRAKPITVAVARHESAHVLRVVELLALESLEAFDALLQRPGPWVGGFDFPFGLPRELVLTQDWPTDWEALIQCYADHSRAELRERFVAFCANRPAGAKFAHRATDRPAGSSPSMKWVNPPVAWMLHAGAPRLLAAGVDIPGLRRGDPSRVALEAYPGLLARAITRVSYKSDDRAKQDTGRLQARGELVRALASGRHPLDLAVRFKRGLRGTVQTDPRGDWLDAVLCAVQAAWAHAQGPHYGFPPAVDPLEGWIVGAGFISG